MRPLTFTSPAFQSAVSIKEGCSSYVFPIHQRPRDTRPHTDGQLDMMEREKVDIRQWREKKWKYWGRKWEKGVRKVEFNWKQQREWRRRKWSKMSSMQTAEAAICPAICFVQGGPLSLHKSGNIVTLHNKQNACYLPNNILQEAVKSNECKYKGTPRK